MAKKKTKVALKDLGKERYKNNLRAVHPFLNRKFRPLKLEELDSEEVFKELFGEEKFQVYKLRAIWEFQK